MLRCRLLEFAMVLCVLRRGRYNQAERFDGNGQRLTPLGRYFLFHAVARDNSREHPSCIPSLVHHQPSTINVEQPAYLMPDKDSFIIKFTDTLR